MKIAILIASRNRPDLVENLAATLGRNVKVDADWISVEAGSDPDKLTPYTTIHFEDEEFSGFCMAHAVGMEHARKLSAEGANFDYYWILTHDLTFTEGAVGSDPVAPLIEVMERHPELALLSATRTPQGQTTLESYQDESHPRAGGGWRRAIPREASGFLIRAAAVEQCGFLNPAFRYAEGAMAELTYTLRKGGWAVGYCDDVTYGHAGETTYGVEGTKTISAAERDRRARRFAYTYFLRICGSDWAEQFGQPAHAEDLATNAYQEQRRDWASAFQAAEISDLHASCATAAPLFLQPGGQRPASASISTTPVSAAPVTVTPPGPALPAPTTRNASGAWPLATEAPHRLLAWPRYDDASDIESLLGAWGDALVDEPERCLCLRLDPERDIDLADATRMVEDVYARLVGEEHTLDVLFVDDVKTEDDLRRLGRAVDGLLKIPGCDDAARDEFARLVGAPELDNLHELLLMH